MEATTLKSAISKAAPNPEREARILDAAGRLVQRYGFDKTSVDEIAAEAGISKGAVYLHFASKDDLLEALLWRETWLYVDDFFARMDADPLGGTVVGMVRHSMAAIMDRPLSKAMFNRDVRILGDFLKRRQPGIIPSKSLMRVELMTALQQAGLVKPDIDVRTVAHILQLFSIGFLSVDESLAPNAPDYLHTLAILTEILEPYITPAGLTESDAGKRLMHQATDAFRESITRQAKKEPTS